MSTNNFVPSLRFAVMSDIHVNRVQPQNLERFRKGADIVKRVARASKDYNKLDALYVVGDFADQGSEEQMLDFKNALDEKLDAETEITITLASHEFNHENGGEPAAIERFKRIYGMECDTHKVINGFHFIALTTTNGCHFDDAKKSWLDAQLKEAASSDPKKPIFVFQHPHLTDTVYGSIDWGEDELISTLMNYPQVVDFSGHSHAPLNDPRSIHQKYFTSVGTGSLALFELDEFDKIYSTKPPRSRECAQFLIVEVSADNRVRIYPYDILTDNYFPLKWDIDTPSDPLSFKYTDARYKTTVAPYFTDKDSVSVKTSVGGSANIAFTQATSDADNYVNAYEIVIQETHSGVIRKQLSIWSEFYFYDMPESLSIDITGLDPNQDYTVKIYATSFWKTRSKTPLETRFTAQ